jgi:signal transduction histidine kinase
MTTTTVLRVSRSSPAREKACAALRDAGFGVAEADDWQQAADAVRRNEGTLVVCDGEALGQLAEGRPAAPAGLPREVARALSHELRTPLSAMAGWLHLMESGKLDAQGLERAIAKLRGNIEDQVRTIERVLGTKSQEGERQ